MIESENAYKIFIIDDSVFIRNTLMDLLPELGFDVVGMSSTVKDAFKYVAETRPDLVLLDTSMPDFTTHEIIRGLVAINSKLEIIVLAPLSNLNQIASLLRVGARDYIPKPLVDRQVEYVLKSYEFSSRVQPRSEIEMIAELHSMYYSELLKHAPITVYRLIKTAIHAPLKRLRSRYKDRYDIDIEQLRIHLKMAKDMSDNKINRMYKNQLDRLFKSIADRLNKDLPEEYVYSVLLEAYQSYYQLAQYLLEHVDFNFPKWNGYTLTLLRSRAKLDARFDYVYAEGSDIQVSKELDIKDPNEKLQVYRMRVKHDPRVAPKFPRFDPDEIMNYDMHILLSYFDDIYGPKASIIVPPPHGRMERDKLQSVPKFMDLVGASPGEPFIHSLSDYGSINMFFSVPSTDRGGERAYMLSIVISPVEVQVMVKISQLGAIMRAVSAAISNHYREFLLSDDKESKMDLLTEPQNILKELLEEVRKFVMSH